MEQTNEKLTKEFCKSESKKYTSRGAFAKGSPTVYNKSRREGWLDEFVWLKPQRHEKGYWTEARCEEIARSYKRMHDFQTENLGCYNAAKRNGWLKNYTWLEMVYPDMKPRGYWDIYQNAYDEARLYNSYREFAKGSGAAYNSALAHGWLDDYDWFKGNRKKKKEYYTYEICSELSKKCENRTQFSREYPTAYNVSNENGWLDDYTWLGCKKRKKPERKGYWDVRENCLNESLKYTKRSTFREKSNSAYKSSVKNGWIDDFTWLEKWDYGRIWTKEVCERDARRFTRLVDYRKNSKNSYDAARKNGWIKDFVWLERIEKPKGYWDESACRTEALKFSDLKTFRECSGSAYNKAYTNGWLKEYTWLKHHEKLGQEHILSEEKKQELHNKFAKTTEQFIEEARAVHGDKYDYSKTVYKRNCEKVCIICPEHGEFWQTPKSHLKGNGCRECGFILTGDATRKSNEQFLNEITGIWGDELDFSKVDYVNNRVPVCVVCHKKDKDGNEHGEFFPMPHNLLNGHGCPKCGNERNAENSRKTVEKLIEDIRKVHGDKYNLSHITEYQNTETPIWLKCEKHGWFQKRPHTLIIGQGCPECARESMGDKICLTQEEFIERAKEKHGDKYDYSKTKYYRYDTPVTIICPIHGEFEQKPSSHLAGNGCHKCHESHNERDTAKAFDTAGIVYERQKRFPWLGQQSLDFYIPEKNIGIECQSSLHYNDNYLRKKKGEEYAKKQLSIVQERDARKKRLCGENGVHLVYFMNKQFLKYADKNDVNFTSFDDLVAYIQNYQKSQPIQ